MHKKVLVDLGLFLQRHAHNLKPGFLSQAHCPILIELSIPISS